MKRTVSPRRVCVAYVVPGGRIRMGRECPVLAIPLAKGTRARLQRAINGTACLGPDGKSFFVPGFRDRPGHELVATYRIVLMDRVEAMAKEALARGK